MLKKVMFFQTMGGSCFVISKLEQEETAQKKKVRTPI